jgi:hypothetical protein
MSIPQYDTEKDGIEPPPPSPDTTSQGWFETYIKNRFDRLYRRTQPRQAIEKSRRDFEERRRAALEAPEPKMR